jgi:hypothetical protein
MRARSLVLRVAAMLVCLSATPAVADWKLKRDLGPPSYAVIEPEDSNLNIGSVVLACEEAGGARVVQLQIYLSTEGPLLSKRARPLLAERAGQPATFDGEVMIALQPRRGDAAVSIVRRCATMTVDAAGAMTANDVPRPSEHAAINRSRLTRAAVPPSSMPWSQRFTPERHGSNADVVARQRARLAPAAFARNAVPHSPDGRRRVGGAIIVVIPRVSIDLRYLTGTPRSQAAEVQHRSVELKAEVRRDGLLQLPSAEPSFLRTAS